MILAKRAACALILILLFSVKTIAQRSPAHQLFLRNRVVSLSGIIDDEKDAITSRQHLVSGRKSLVILQFDKIPDELVRTRLQELGVELLEFVPDNAYTATLTEPADKIALRKMGVQGVYRPATADIVAPSLLSNVIPDHARKIAGKIDVRLSFVRTFAVNEVIRDINMGGFELLSQNLQANQILDLRIPEGSILRLAEFPWVQYIQPVPGPTELLNDKSAASTKANVLGSKEISGYGLTGEGVVIGLGDDSNPIVHADIGRRVIDYVPLNNTWHGIHVSGTMAGSGLLNEKYKGYAPKSKIVVRGRNQIWENAGKFVRDYGMVVTSNTYGGSSYCEGFGEYSDGSYVLDQQAFQYPYLQHVFASGNSGLVANCKRVVDGFGTVLGDYQSAKNILTVGMTQANGIINATSSKGPTRDGRIKPEVTAPGTNIWSGGLGNLYHTGTGTSMATPAVTGGAALLYQRYRQLNQQNNPKNALIKALICNGATDQGLPGPDYTYGFGQMNLLRSVTMMDRRHYFSGEVNHQDKKTHEITVPPNTARLKVLIYWNDPSPSPLAGGKALVNNLDLSVFKPGNIKVLPKFPSGLLPAAVAMSGVDSVNNVEQIVIEAPVTGKYSVQVAATMIPQGSQEYFVVYDIIETSLIVTYPLAGEHLTKGDAINVCWDSYGDTLSTFNVAYSLDNGAGWTTINAGVLPSQRQLSWTVPDAATANAKVRITKNGTGFTNVSGPFTILGIPGVTLQSAQCEGYIALQWNAVNGAADYEVMLSTGDEMKSVMVTSELKYTISGLSKDSTYYVSVRARKNQVPGRRSVAIIRKPDNGTCQGSISDNDLTLEAVVTPLPTVRTFTKAAYSAEQSITVRIKNLDDQPQAKPFEVGYAIGGGVMHWEQVSTTLPATSSIDYTFQQRTNLAATNTASLLVRTRLAADPVKGNDSLRVMLRQISNPKLVLPYLQNVESVPVLDIRASVAGIPGADAYDFTPVSGNARLRTADHPEVGYLSRNAFILDGITAVSAASGGFLDGTFNLSGYRVTEDEIRLHFRHTYQGYFARPGFRRVYIRGSSNDPWILAYTREDQYYEDLDDSYHLASIEVTPLLKMNDQELTRDFQVRWAVEAFGDFPIDGWAIDDIRLIKTVSDVAVVSLEAPSFSLCDSFSPHRVSALIKNNGSDNCYNVPIKMSFDGVVFDHKIDVIRKDSLLRFEFYYPAEAFQAGKHQVKVWCEKASDINMANDTLEVEFFTTGAVSASPYLETFDSGNGGWYTAGTNSSWQLGRSHQEGFSTPAGGRNVWKTNLTGGYNSSEESYLYSPCIDLNYDFSYLSFNARMEMEECSGDDCDKLYIEYNYGYGWLRLGSKNDGGNWYNSEKDWQGFWSGKAATGLRVFTVPLPQMKYLRLRFVFKSNAAGEGEGITIDDIHIYNNLGRDIYGGASVPEEFGPVYMPDNDWTHYTIDNNIVASIHPRGQDIGGIKLRTFVNEGPLRVSGNQFVMDRNFVLSSSKRFNVPVSVRLYIPQSDIDRLVAANEQPNVDKVRSVYDLAVTKYSGQSQDGDLVNNSKEAWEYFAGDKVTKVPYRDGYFIEFNTKTFSEFWLAKDYIGTGTPLPVTLISFNAEKKITGENTAVYLKWSTDLETDFSHFVVQVAANSEHVKMGLFDDLGKVAGQGLIGTRQYSFVDHPASIGSTRYYRLKIVDADGSFTYSNIKPVAFDQNSTWHIYPNPSDGLFRLELKGEERESVQIDVIDLAGEVRRKLIFRGTSPLVEVDLRSPDLADGLYVIRVILTDREQQFKVVKKSL